MKSRQVGVHLGAKLLKTRLKAVQQCATAVFACAQVDAGDAACVAKARATCAKAFAGLGASGDEADLVTAVVKGCAGGTLTGDDLRSAIGLGFDASAAECATLGVPSLDGPTQIGECVGRRLGCRARRAVESLDLQRSGADQVGEPLALLRLEQRVQPSEGLGDGVSQVLGRGDADGAATARALGVEPLAADRVGERRGRAPAIHLCLRALGFQVVENASELSDLTLVEAELVGEKPQRTPDAERAGTEIAVVRRGHVSVMPTPVTATTEGLTCKRAVLGMCATTVTGVTQTPPVHHSWIHRSSSRGGDSLPTGFFVRGHHASRTIDGTPLPRDVNRRPLVEAGLN
jgi:hypothetical protein